MLVVGVVHARTRVSGVPKRALVGALLWLRKRFGFSGFSAIAGA
jgi:hypothetical protein